MHAGDFVTCTMFLGIMLFINPMQLQHQGLINLTLSHYEIFIIFPSSQLTQRDVENTIDRETSGDFGKGLLTMGNLDHMLMSTKKKIPKWKFRENLTIEVNLFNVIIVLETHG